MSNLTLNSLFHTSYPLMQPPVQKKSGTLDSPDRASLADKSHQESVTVTLSDGSTAIQKVTSTPLAVAWAPQSFVQADANGNKQLTLNEFQNQLERAGIAASSATKLFTSFDQTKDGSVSMEEYVDGVNNSVKSGSDLFNKVIDTYTTDQTGAMSENATNSFLATGLEAANAYWKNSR